MLIRKIIRISPPRDAHVLATAQSFIMYLLMSNVFFKKSRKNYILNTA